MRPHAVVALASMVLAVASSRAEWPQWGGSSTRNSVAQAGKLVQDWLPGKFDRKTRAWNPTTSANVKWVAQLGSQTYGAPVVAGGRIYVGTNNGAGYVRRYPKEIDLGCLLCFRESDGAFLWQFSAEKLRTGRVHDWPLMGIASSPLVEGERAWFVSNRGEVVCVDPQGYHDGEDDGPEMHDASLPLDRREADVRWRFDMMRQLGSSQHNLATCCITSWKETLFVCTGNGVDNSHIHIPAPDAPSFFAMDKTTGRVLWTSNLPGKNIHHGQWSAPAVGLLGGVPQVVFCGGDGWVYSFHAEEYENHRPRLLWKFDTNPKDAELVLGGRGTRCEPIAPPVLHGDRVFVTVGQDPEHGEGPGRIWCIDPTKRLDGSDVSPHRVVDREGRDVPPRRVVHLVLRKESLLYAPRAEQELAQSMPGEDLRRSLKSLGQELPAEVAVRAVTPGAEWELSFAVGERRETVQIFKRRQLDEAGKLKSSIIAAHPTGERIVENPDSAVVWKYDQVDRDGNGKIEFHEQMHRSIASVAIEGELLFAVDFAGLVHCLDVRSGQPHWTCDLLAASWATPLIADGRVFVGDEDGDVAIFRLSADPEKAGVLPDRMEPRINEFHPAQEINMISAVYCGPVASDGVLYIVNKDHLFAIGTKGP